MKKFAALIIVLTLHYSPLAFAQDPEPSARIETMLKSLKPGELEFAIPAFAKDSLIPKGVVDSIMAQTKSVMTLDKSILGYELIQEQNIGTSVKRFTYVLKMSDQPVYWNFSFYKPADKWVPLNLYFFFEQ